MSQIPLITLFLLAGPGCERRKPPPSNRTTLALVDRVLASARLEGLEPAEAAKAVFDRYVYRRAGEFRIVWKASKRVIVLKCRA